MNFLNYRIKIHKSISNREPSNLLTRDGNLLLLRTNGETLQYIGDIYNISRERVRQITQRYINVMTCQQDFSKTAVINKKEILSLLNKIFNEINNIVENKFLDIKKIINITNLNLTLINFIINGPDKSYRKFNIKTLTNLHTFPLKYISSFYDPKSF